MLGLEKIYILGIGISKITKEAAQQTMAGALESGRQLHISTPNPEIVLNCQNDEELHYIINYCDMAIPDGIGLKFASWLMWKNISRWPGSDITIWLLEHARKKGYKAAILNKEGGLSSRNEIRKSISDKYPGLIFEIFDCPSDWKNSNLDELKKYEPKILFVALGSPFQEKFIRHNKGIMARTSIFIGVGGSFDYLTGKIKQTPALFKKLGLEWLWRIINLQSYSDPWKRLKRILNAVVVFPFKFLKWRFINPLIYRKNVLCLLYKIFDQQIFVLLLERNGGSGHWQLPQGGTDGRSLIEAGRKELEEELHTDNFIPQAAFKNIHKYRFNKNEKELIRFKFRNYKGQKQGLLIAEYMGDSQEISVNYWEYVSWQWVKLEEIADMVDPVRKTATEKAAKNLEEYLVKAKKFPQTR